MIAEQLLRNKAPYDGDVFSIIIPAIQNRGYIVIDNIFTNTVLESLFLDIKQTDSHLFSEAGIGHDLNHNINQFVRRDRIRWLDNKYEPAKFYFNWMDHLRLRINQQLYLGLFDFECHFSHYPAGGFYKKHLDAFRDRSTRILSTILYLNPGWRSGDGGELVLYKKNGDELIGSVLPTFGTMVLFLSEEFPHEVLISHQSRYSLTGWFHSNRIIR